MRLNHLPLYVKLYSKTFFRNIKDNLKQRKYNNRVKEIIGRENYEVYKRDLVNSDLINILNKKRAEFERNYAGKKSSRGIIYTFGGVSLSEGINLYMIIRKFNPLILVETGVCNGFSTSFMLLAIEHNKKNAKLYSIDYPEFTNEIPKDLWEGKGGAVVPGTEQPGWIIPDNLKRNWTLILGKSQEVLVPLLSDLKKIDFFMHDSEHSEQCMLFEYQNAIHYLGDNGILASDDIGWTEYFKNFIQQFHKKIIYLSENMGFIIK